MQDSSTVDASLGAASKPASSPARACDQHRANMPGMLARSPLPTGFTFAPMAVAALTRRTSAGHKAMTVTNIHAKEARHGERWLPGRF